MSKPRSHAPPRSGCSLEPPRQMRRMGSVATMSTMQRKRASVALDPKAPAPHGRLPPSVFDERTDQGAKFLVTLPLISAAVKTATLEVLHGPLPATAPLRKTHFSRCLAARAAPKRCGAAAPWTGSPTTPRETPFRLLVADQPGFLAPGAWVVCSRLQGLRERRRLPNATTSRRHGARPGPAQAERYGQSRRVKRYRSARSGRPPP